MVARIGGTFIGFRRKNSTNANNDILIGDILHDCCRNIVQYTKHFGIMLYSVRSISVCSKQLKSFQMFHKTNFDEEIVISTKANNNGIYRRLSKKVPSIWYYIHMVLSTMDVSAIEHKEIL